MTEEPKIYSNKNLRTKDGEINGTITIHLEHIKEDYFIQIISEVHSYEMKITSLLKGIIHPVPPELSVEPEITDVNIRKQPKSEKRVEEPPIKKPLFKNNKWKIPFAVKTKINGKLKQTPEYSEAYLLCRKYQLPYPEALKRKEEDETGVIEQPPIEEPEVPPVVTNGRRESMPNLVKNKQMVYDKETDLVGTVVGNRSVGINKEYLVRFEKMGAIWLKEKNLNLWVG